MTKKYWLVGAVCLILGSCSKSKLTDQPAPDAVDDARIPGSVVINGEIYSTITIGNLEWTTVNYNGDGGVESVGAEFDDVIYGKLYTESEAKAIELPPGWRLPNPADFTQLLLREIPKYTRGDDIVPEITLRYMAKQSWLYNDEGTNTTGFKAVAAGRYAEDILGDTIYYGVGTTAVFLMVDSTTTDETYRRAISIDKNEGTRLRMTDIIPKIVYRNGKAYNLNNRYSLRFVRNRVLNQ